jgi:hypothetical protein
MTDPKVSTGFREAKTEVCHRCGKDFPPEVGYKVQMAEVRAHLDRHASQDRRNRALREEQDRTGLPGNLVRGPWGAFSRITRAELDEMDRGPSEREQDAREAAREAERQAYIEEEGWDPYAEVDDAS